MVAAGKGDAANTELIIEAGPPLDSVDDLGNSALLRAALNARPQIVEQLLEAGADREVSNKAGQTALDCVRPGTPQAGNPGWTKRQQDCATLLE